MKRFKSSLEAVRVLRRRHEREAMENYARALLEQACALAALEEIERELALRWREWKEHLAAGCDATEMIHRHRHEIDLQSRRQQSATRVKAASDATEEAFNAMLRARQGRETVDKFRENQRAAHAREQDRQEQKFLDELAGRRRDPALGAAPLDPDNL